MGKHTLIYFTVLIKMLLITLILSLLLLIIFYQDLRYRGVWWPVFPVVFVVQLLYSMKSIGYHELVPIIIMNGLILITQLMILYLYLTVKKKNLKIPLFKEYLGWGDVLMVLVLTTSFSPLNYIVFLLLGLLFSLLAVLLSRGRLKTIPLAGIVAAEYCIFIWIIYFNPQIEPYVELIPVTP